MSETTSDPSVTKPGYKTTEFYVAVLTAFASLVAAIDGGLPPKYAAIGAAIASGAYSISRGIAKFGPSIVSLLGLLPALQSIRDTATKATPAIIAALLIPALGLTSCATQDGSTSQFTRVVATTINTLTPLAGSFAAGQLDKNDLHAVADGLRTFEGVAQPISADDIQSIVNAWSSNPDPAAKKSLGEKLSSVWAASGNVRKDVLLEAMATAAQIFAAQFGNNHALIESRVPGELVAADWAGRCYAVAWVEIRG